MLKMTFRNILLLLWGLSLSKGIPLKSDKIYFNLIHELKSKCPENYLLDVENPNLQECGKCDLEKFDKTTLNCLSFLDINRRFCEINQVAAFNLTERLENEQSKNITTDLVCSTDSGITFKSIPEFPQYRDKIKYVYSNKETCLKLCMSEDSDLFDIRPNFYCKVLYSETNIIKNIQKVDSQTIFQTTVKQSYDPLKQKLNEKKIPKVTNERSDLVTQDEITKIPVSSEDKQNENEDVENNKIIKNPDEIHKQSDPITPKFPVTNKDKTDFFLKKQEDTYKQSKTVNQEEKPIDLPEKNAEPKNKTHTLDPKIKITSNQVSNLPTITSELPNNNAKTPIVQPKDISKSTPIVIGDPKKDYVSPEEKIIPGEESDYGDDNDNNRDELQFNNEPGSIGKEIVQAEIIPRYEDTIDEVDNEGSFFPLFFFGVATMVMMYILYHNKNRVSARIMGLLIEGRNSGNRRRTSRGHAYRRLDTLEQAMSTQDANVTPSKIIY